jgi:hypothetical protein
VLLFYFLSSIVYSYQFFYIKYHFSIDKYVPAVSHYIQHLYNIWVSFVCARISHFFLVIEFVMTVDNGSFSVVAYSCLFGVVAALLCGLIWVVLFWVVFELVLFALLFHLLTTLRFVFWILVSQSFLLRDWKLASSYKFLGWFRCLLRSCGSWGVP